MLAKTTKIIKKIAIFGDAEAKKTSQHFIDAYNTAKLLSQNGYTIVNGGGGGVMLAATLGAKAGGGRVEIVVLDPKKKPDNFEGYNKENHDLANKIYLTPNYPQRLIKLIEVGEAFVIFNGGVGTLSEIGLSWQMAKFDFGHHEPLIFFGEQMNRVIEELVGTLNYDPLEKKIYEVVLTPEEVLKTIQNRKGDGKIEKKGLLGRLMDLIK